MLIKLEPRQHLLPTHLVPHGQCDSGQRRGHHAVELALLD
jgi:hypothetical protein